MNMRELIEHYHLLAEDREADLALLDQIQVMDKPALITLADGNYKGDSSK
jgi:hypothetical protein